MGFGANRALLYTVIWYRAVVPDLCHLECTSIRNMLCASTMHGLSLFCCRPGFWHMSAARDGAPSGTLPEAI